MNAPNPDYAPMDERQRANVQGIIDVLTEMGEAVGSWTSKRTARTTGATYYATFEKRVDVHTSMMWLNQIEQCPALLADACRKLLAADAALRAQIDGSGSGS